jgi:hypothetical protein
MASITFPALSVDAPGSVSLSLVADVQQLESPLDKTVQTVAKPGARWKASFSYNNLQEADASLMQAFLIKLRGRFNTFPFYPFEQPEPIGTQRGSPVVDGAHAAGATEIDLRDVTNGATLLAGDFIGLGSQLCMVAEDVTFSGTTGTVEITIPMRKALADGVALVWDRPTVEMRYVPDQVGWSSRPGYQLEKFSDFAFDCVEVFQA